MFPDGGGGTDPVCAEKRWAPWWAANERKSQLNLWVSIQQFRSGRGTEGTEGGGKLEAEQKGGG